MLLTKSIQLVVYSFTVITIVTACQTVPESLKQENTNALSPVSSGAALIDALKPCGVSSMVIPDDLGNWTKQEFQAEDDHDKKYISINFENGKQEDAALLVRCDAYGGSTGREQDIFATYQDYEALQKDSNAQNIRGVKVIQKETVSDWGYNEQAAVRKIIIFPRSETYLAVIFEMPSDKAKNDLQNLQQKKASPALQNLWQEVETVAASVQF